jgi:hypothetical protein
MGRDPLAIMQCDESMGHRALTTSKQYALQMGYMKTEKSLRVVCDPDNEMQSFKRSDHLPITAKPLLLEKRRLDDTQMRMRLHSNFTSIDRRPMQGSRTDLVEGAVRGH